VTICQGRQPKRAGVLKDGCVCYVLCVDGYVCYVLCVLCEAAETGWCAQRRLCVGEAFKRWKDEEWLLSGKAVERMKRIGE
jgi:hypothetical protein